MHPTKLLPIFITFLVSAFLPLSAFAAEFHSGDTVTLDQEAGLNNAYIAGKTVTIGSDVQNDLVVAGQNLAVNADVEGNLIAAGNDITVTGNVGRNARIAGNHITINGTITQDLMVFGSELTVTEDANINGDLVYNGGQITIDGTVAGTIYTNSSQAIINGSVGSLHAWHVNSLTLGANAEIANDLTYSSPNQAKLERGSIIHGAIDYQESDRRQIISGINNTLFYYGLLANMIFCLAMLLLIRKVVSEPLAKIGQNSLLCLGIGLTSLVFMPIIAALAMLVSIWLGLVILLLYALLLILCLGLSQILIGWGSLKWWFGRSKQSYDLDWRAAIIGVLLATLLLYVPVLGWFILFLAFLLSLGGLIQGISRLR